MIKGIIKYNIYYKNTKKRKVIKLGVKRLSKKLFNGVLNLGIFAGSKYAKESTGVNNAVRGAKMFKFLNRFIVPIVASTVGLVALGVKKTYRFATKNRPKKRNNSEREPKSRREQHRQEKEREKENTYNEEAVNKKEPKQEVPIKEEPILNEEEQYDNGYEDDVPLFNMEEGMKEKEIELRNYEAEYNHSFEYYEIEDLQERRKALMYFDGENKDEARMEIDKKVDKILEKIS